MIAFFPGKFQPAHLGHVLTVMSLYDKYDEILIGITDDTPHVCSRRVTKGIFHEVFHFLPKVKVVLINGVLCDKASTRGLPNFDVLLSGNPKVIKWAKIHSVKCEYIPRSEGLGFSGTEIRSIPSGGKALPAF